MGNETSSHSGGGGGGGGDRVVQIRRSTFQSKTFKSSLPLQIISVDVKNKDETWTQYTACLYRKKGGYSLEYGNVGDQFAVAMQLSSIDAINVDRMSGGAGVRIVQGSDPRHNKVTTFRFDSLENAQKFRSTIQDYQREEAAGVSTGRLRAASRGGGGGAGSGYGGEPPQVRRSISTEDERALRELQQKFMAPKAAARRSSGSTGGGQQTPTQKKAWAQSRAAKHVWDESKAVKSDGKKMEFSSFAANSVDEKEYQRRVALNKMRQKGSDSADAADASDSQRSLLRKSASAIQGLPDDADGDGAATKKKKARRAGGVTLKRRGQEGSVFELENTADSAAGVTKLKFDVGDVKRVLPQGSKIMLEFSGDANKVMAMDVGSAKAATEWVNDIVNAQLAALRINPTLYSGWALLSVEGEERERFLRLQGRTLFVYYDDSMERPDMKFDLFIEGCDVSRKKFKHSGQFSDTQFWLQLALPAEPPAAAAATAASSGGGGDGGGGAAADAVSAEVCEFVSILCEVDAHALQPWLALLDAAIKDTVLGFAGAANPRSAPFVLQCLVKETLQTELSYLRRLRKLIVDFINPMKQSLPEAATFLFGRSGVEVIYSVNMSYLCDLAVEIGNAALPRDVVEQAGVNAAPNDQCIYLPPDLVVLVLEVLEFCCKDPKSLSQIAERNGLYICCAQLHHSAKRLQASRSAETHHEGVQRLCKTILDSLQKHSDFSVDELKQALERDYSIPTHASASTGSHEYQALTLSALVAAETMGLVSHLKCYKNYFIHYDKIVENLHNLGSSQPRRYTSKSRLLKGTRMEPQALPRVSNKEYQELRDGFQDDHGRPLLIESFLIEPVQRVPRYVMLVEQIYKQSTAILEPPKPQKQPHADGPGAGAKLGVGESASSTVDGAAGEDAATTGRAAAAKAVPVDETMVGDTVTVGGVLEGVLFDVLPGGVAKVSVTGADGGFLDVDMYAHVSKLALTEDAFAQAQEADEPATYEMDTTPMASPGAPGSQDPEHDAVLAAVREQFSSLLANVQTVLKQSKAVATYLDEAILQFAMQQRLKLIKALTPNWPAVQSTSSPLNTVECQVLAECQFEVISACALTGQHSGAGIWHLVIVDDLVVMLAVMKEDRAKEFARPGQDPIVDLNEFTILSRPLQRMHFVGCLERKNIKLSMSMTSLPAAPPDAPKGDGVGGEGGGGSGSDDAQDADEPAQIRRSDSVAIKAQAMLDDGIITQDEFDALVSAPRIEPVTSPRATAAAAAKVAEKARAQRELENSPRVGRLVSKPQTFFNNIGRLFDPVLGHSGRQAVRTGPGPRAGGGRAAFDPALVLKLEETNQDLPFWAFDAGLASWTVLLRLGEFPQFLACFLQHQALVRVQRFGTDGGGGGGAEAPGGDEISGVVDRLSLSNEELIHSPTPEQFLYAAATARQASSPAAS